MEPKVGWMDSIGFDHELGEALGGNSVYSSKEDCEKHHPCIASSADAGIPVRCRAMRVYVFNADEFDREYDADFVKKVGIEPITQDYEREPIQANPGFEILATVNEPPAVDRGATVLTNGSPVTPDHREINPATGQQKAYVVLTAEERKKGFVRPLRNKYRHAGIRPKHPTRDLTEEEKKRHSGCSYVAYEEYPPNDHSSVIGRYWTQAQLKSGCNSVTTMSEDIAETYARILDFTVARFVACAARIIRLKSLCGKEQASSLDREMADWLPTEENIKALPLPVSNLLLDLIKANKLGIEMPKDEIKIVVVGLTDSKTLAERK